MDLNFVPTTRRPFSMEVGYFDKIQEIKEKIQKYHKIPARKQTLIFNNQILHDHLNIHPTEIVDNSRIQLIISEDPPPEHPTTVIVKQESRPPPPPPPPPEIPTTVVVKQESSPPLPETSTATTPSKKSRPPPPPEIPTTVVVKQESSPPLPETSTATTPSKKITLVLKMLPTPITGMKIELEVDSTVRKLKEKINELDCKLPFWKLVLRSNGVDLDDHKTLHECGLLTYSEIDISFKHSAPTNPSKPTIKNHNVNNPENPRIPKDPSNATTNRSTMDSNNTNDNSRKNKNSKKLNISKTQNKLKIMVLPFKGKKKVAVEVNANDNVEELRKELKKVNEREALNLSGEGFYFIHKQDVMDEDRSFRSYNVRQGDTIEIINGQAPEIVVD